MLMKTNSIGRKLVMAFAVAGAILAGSALANAQSVTLSYDFTASGNNTLTLLPGVAGATVGIDIYATVFGDGTHTDPTMYGLGGFHLRGFSDIASGGGAFATGATIGPVAGTFAGYAPFTGTLNSPTPADNGSTTTGIPPVSTTKDGIKDIGATSNTLSDLTMAAGANSVMASAAGSAGNGPSAGGWVFKVGHFNFTYGTVSATGGATTEFIPTRPNSGTSAIITQDGTASDQVNLTTSQWNVGTPLIFSVANVGPTGETADNSNTVNTFGPAKTVPVGTSGTYSGIGSTVVALQGTGGSDARPNSSSTLGGQATILAGTNTVANGGGTATVSLSWRTRLSPSEVSPAQHPPIPAGVTTGLVSDVLNLSGMTTSGASHTTDPFVLDMSYNPALLPKGGPPAIENGLAHNKLIYMVSPSNSTDGGPYVNTVALDTGNVVSDPLSNKYGYFGSYAAFQADANGGAGGTPASELGAWGIDTTAHEVWAVVNHNSEFAVVPEPSTFVLGGLGIVGLIVARRRNKKVL